jgi:hypothetical protein
MLPIYQVALLLLQYCYGASAGQMLLLQLLLKILLLQLLVPQLLYCHSCYVKYFVNKI